MAFMNRVGNLLKHNASTQILNSRVSASSTPFALQAVRYISSSKIFIGGLSYNTDDVGLKEAFAAYGEVVETKVICDRDTGRSRGFGFVSFTSGEEAASAVQAMDGQDLHGRRVRVNFATDRVGGFRSQGGYGNTGYGGGYGGGGAYNSTNDGGYGGNVRNTENAADGTNSFASGTEFNIRDAMGAGDFEQDIPVEDVSNK